MPKWRKSAWALAIWNVLMILWFVRVISALDDFSCATESRGFGLAVCQAGAIIGQNFGVSLVIIVWLIGSIPLALLWLITRPKLEPR